MTTADRKYVSQKEAAERYGTTERTIRDWIRRGIITGYRMPGGRSVRVDLNEIDAKVEAIPTAKVGA